MDDFSDAELDDDLAAAIRLSLMSDPEEPSVTDLEDPTTPRLLRLQQSSPDASVTISDRQEALPSSVAATEHQQLVEPACLYQYQPLPTPHSIRLIRFELALNRPTARPTLVICSLNDPDVPRYATLSHCWGETFSDGSHLSEDLVCEEGIIKVTKSVGGALDRIRGIARPPAHRDTAFALLWVDSICINQADVVERNIQVTLMPMIYSKCCNMIIWIGQQPLGSKQWHETFSSKLPQLYATLVALDQSDGDISIPSYKKTPPRTRYLTHTPLLPDFSLRRFISLPTVDPHFKRVLEKYSELSPNEMAIACRLMASPPVEYKRICRLGNLALEDYLYSQDPQNNKRSRMKHREAYAELVQAGWFNRKWVIQEMAQTRGKQQTFLTTGTEVTAADLRSALQEVSLLEYARPLNATRMPRTLLENLALYRDTRCSIAHDHVYALMGLSSDIHWLEVKYDLDVNDLYTSVAGHACHEGQHIYTLALATTQRSTHGLPSWVPDWREIWQCDRSAMHADAMATVGAWGRKLWLESEVSPSDLSIELTHAGSLCLEMKAWIVTNCDHFYMGDDCNCAKSKLLGLQVSSRRLGKRAIVDNRAVTCRSPAGNYADTSARSVRHKILQERWGEVIRSQFEATMHRDEVLCLLPDCALAFVLLPTGCIDESCGSKTYKLEFCFQIDEERWISNWFAEILGSDRQEWVRIV